MCTGIPARDKDGDIYRRSMGSGMRGVCLNFDASHVELFPAGRIFRNEDVLVRLVKTVDFAGGRGFPHTERRSPIARGAIRLFATRFR